MTKRHSYLTLTLAVGETVTNIVPIEGKKVIGFSVGSVAVTGTYLAANISLADTGTLIPAYVSAGTTDPAKLSGTKVSGANTYYKVFDNEIYSGVKRISLTSQAAQAVSPAVITLVLEEER